MVACKLMWSNIQTISPSPNINAELLLASRMDYTMMILLYPLVFVVNIDDAKVTVEMYYLMMAREAKTYCNVLYSVLIHINCTEINK